MTVAAKWRMKYPEVQIDIRFGSGQVTPVRSGARGMVSKRGLVILCVVGMRRNSVMMAREGGGGVSAASVRAETAVENLTAAPCPQAHSRDLRSSCVVSLRRDLEHRPPLDGAAAVGRAKELAV
jgi:hypothetical protein